MLPGTEAGQPRMNPVRPSSASSSARPSGRTSTIPWRRSSTRTSSSESSTMGFARSTTGQQSLVMGTTARRVAVATLVVLGIVIAALALWKIKVVIALVFLGVIVAAAMRPGVVWLERRARIPRTVGVLLHYLALFGFVTLVLWLFVPRAIDQVQQATSGNALHRSTVHSTGIKHEILSSLEKRLTRLPSGAKLVHPALEITKTAFEVLVGIFFMFAV